MSSKTKTTLKITAIILVLLMILIHLGWIYIPALAGYKFWITVGAFALLLIATK